MKCHPFILLSKDVLNIAQLASRSCVVKFPIPIERQCHHYDVLYADLNI